MDTTIADMPPRLIILKCEDGHSKFTRADSAVYLNEVAAQHNADLLAHVSPSAKFKILNIADQPA